MAVDPSMSYDQKRAVFNGTDPVTQAINRSEAAARSQGTGLYRPNTASGIATAGNLDATPVAAQVQKNLAAVSQPAEGGGGSQPEDIGVQNLATANRFLPGGVTRYQMDPGNEAQVYTTKGKDGSIVFTDNPAYAARVGAGRGLRRSDLNIPNYSNAPVQGRAGVEDTGFPDVGEGQNNGAAANVIARTQGPNANLTYAEGPVAGLRRNIPNLDDQQAERALSVTQAAQPKNADEAYAQAIDRNAIVARIQGLRRQQLNAPGVPGYGVGGALGANGIGAPGGLKFSDIIRANQNAQTNAYRGGMLQQGAQRLKLDQEAADRADRTQQRAESNDFLKNYYTTLEKDPRAANQQLATALNRDDIGDYLKTDAGRAAADTYFQNVIQPGLKTSTYPILDFNSRRAAEQGRVGYGDLQLDPGTGRFMGVRSPLQSASDNSPEFPSTGFFGGSNFDPSINKLAPATLKALKTYYANQQSGGS